MLFQLYNLSYELLKGRKNVAKRTHLKQRRGEEQRMIRFSLTSKILEILVKRACNDVQTLVQIQVKRGSGGHGESSRLKGVKFPYKVDDKVLIKVLSLNRWGLVTAYIIVRYFDCNFILFLS